MASSTKSETSIIVESDTPLMKVNFWSLSGAANNEFIKPKILERWFITTDCLQFRPCHKPEKLPVWGNYRITMIIMVS